MKICYYFSSVFLLIGLFGMINVGCTELEQDELVEKEMEINNLPSSTISLNNGILCFSNMNDFKLTLSELQTELNNYSESWFEGKDTIPDSTILTIQISEGFDYDQPLIDFEEYYEFSSLRAMLASDLEDFLDQENPDWSLNPDVNFIEDEVLRTVLSENYAVKIGSIIYIFLQTGSWYEITDGSFATLDGIIDLTIDPYSASNVNVVEGEEEIFVNKKATNCNSQKNDNDFKPTSGGTAKIEWEVMHKTLPWERYVKATTKNYVKKGVRWRKSTAATIAKVSGYISGVDGNGDANCDSQTPFNPYNNWAEDRNHRVAHKIAVQTKTRPNWITGYHEGEASITHNSVLNW